MLKLQVANQANVSGPVQAKPLAWASHDAWSRDRTHQDPLDLMKILHRLYNLQKT